MQLLLDLHSFPCLQVIAQMTQETQVFIEGHEHFQKGSYRNRYHIAGPNGLQRLSIPLQGGKNNGLPIQAVKIANVDNWAMQHWRSIQAGYGKSPFFEHYADELKELMLSETATLWAWNRQALEWTLEQIGLECQLSITESYEQNPLGLIDLRNHITPKFALESAPEYPQVFPEKNGFLSNLSILDLLFCQGPLAIPYLEKLNQSLPTKSA